MNIIKFKRNLLSGYLPAGFILFLFLLTLSSCKKDKDNVDPVDGLEAISWPQKWVMVTDRDESSYSYIYSTGGLSLYRGGVEKTYSINNLIDEKDCYFEVIPAGYSGTDKLFVIRSVQEPENWWGCFRTNTPFGVEEWFLGQTYENDTPEGDDYRFILHPMPDADGEKTFVIESFLKRGQYLDNVGHNFTGNGLSFVAYDKPENAPRYKMLKPFDAGIGG